MSNDVTDLLGLKEELYVEEGSKKNLYPNNAYYKALIAVTRKTAETGEGVFFFAPHVGNTETQKGVDLSKLQYKNKMVKEVISDFFQGDSAKEDLIRYFLISAACYLEIPKNRYIGGNAVQSYDKYLCTSSKAVVANWMNISIEEAETLLKGKLDTVIEEDKVLEGTIPWVKLSFDSKGNKKIVRSRNLLNLSTPGIRVTPMIILSNYLDVLLEKMEKNDEYMEISYLKDNGDIRKIVTTLNPDLLNEVYPESHVREMLETSENRNEPNQKKRERGYVTVPEVGLPINDSCVRALNFNRIIRIDYSAKPDLRFVDVDLPNVVVKFNEKIETVKPDKAEALIESLIEDGVFNKETWYTEDKGWKKQPTIYNLIEMSELTEKLVGTEFQKKLHLWMVSEVGKLFITGYDGSIKQDNKELNNIFENSFNVGIIVNDFGKENKETLDIDLEF